MLRKQAVSQCDLQSAHAEYMKVRRRRCLHASTLGICLMLAKKHGACESHGGFSLLLVAHA